MPRILAFLALAVISFVPAAAGAACPGAFVVSRQGAINLVEWTTVDGPTTRSHAIVNQISRVDGTIVANADGTTAALRDRSTMRAGATPAPALSEKPIPAGSVVWWETWPSTLQAVLARARVTQRSTAGSDRTDVRCRISERALDV